MSHQIEYRCCKCDAKCCPPAPLQTYVVCPICNRRWAAESAERKVS